MLSSFVTALALAASVSNVAAGPLRHATRGYRQDADILEDYKGYHVRYLALSCHKQHDTQFFEDCCHPLLKWQKLSDRPSQCIPSASASSSAVLAEPTSPPIDEDPIPDYDDDCETETTAKAAAPTTKDAYTPPAPSPEPTTTPKAEPTTSKQPEPTPAPSTTKNTPAPEPTKGSGGEGEITGGKATWFLQGGNAGACGKVHDDYDKVVALDYRRYGPLGEQSSDCGRTVVITNTKNGKSVKAIVADACPSCANGNCLDLSLGAFDAIGARDDGELPIAWHFE